MIKQGIIHGAVIGVVVATATLLLSHFVQSKELTISIVILLLVISWYISARIYKIKYGQITLFMDKRKLNRLFKFAFGAALVWAPLVSLTSIDVSNPDLFLYFTSMVVVLPLATIQVVGILIISNVFIKNKVAK